MPEQRAEVDPISEARLKSMAIEQIIKKQQSMRLKAQVMK
jgi:hypothetical protein